ncbi:MAG: hypothetical protein IKZ78_01820, partial [Firmicutes bacterium]|nr:hypothetical protein [Bacillota bacterium]
MKQSFEYQIYIGCTDSQSKDKLVQEHELKEMVADFFARNQIGFSILSVKGGFYYSDGWFAPEDTLCINVVGDSDLDIMKLARSLSMYMNQECCMISRNALEM